MSTHSEDIWDDDPFADSVQRATKQQALKSKHNEVEDDDSLAQELLPADKMSFTVSDAESASWVVRKIWKRERARRASRNGPKRELQEAKREEEFFARRFGPDLEAWVAENINGRKTLRLPRRNSGFSYQAPHSTNRG
jgi:hypothetical protein